MGLTYELLRSGFPYYITLGQRRITSNPVDIGFGKENIYVLTRGALGTEIRVINWEDENLGVRGGADLFGWPAGLLVDQDENLYVSDEAKHCVVVMDKEGNHRSTWGQYGPSQGQLNRPSGMAFDSEGNILLSDTMNNRVQRFTTTGEHLQTIEFQGLNKPWGVAEDLEGFIYVADWKNDRIVKLSKEGELFLKIGSTGSKKGQLSRPSSVAVDQHGDIYVADTGNNRVQLFSEKGRYVEKFIGDATLSKSMINYMMPQGTPLMLRELSRLEPQKRFRTPRSVAVDHQKKMYVAEFHSFRVQIYEKQAIPLGVNQIAPMATSRKLKTI